MESHISENQIDREKFTHYCKNTWPIFAIVEAFGGGKLIFSHNYCGDYDVYKLKNWETESIYKGTDLQQAIDVFNQNVA